MTTDFNRRDVYVIPGFMETSIQGLFADRGYTIKSDPNESNILVWTGGADINPELYGDPKHPMTSFSSRRDKIEVDLYNQFASKDFLKIGICRGHQLLGAMNGAHLFQHVNNHGRTHDAFYTDENGTTTIHTVSSAHHQMIDLARSDGPFEAWLVSNESTTRERTSSAENALGYDDPESIFWPRSMSLGFQGHPEFGPQACTDLFFDIVERARIRYVASGITRNSSAKKAKLVRAEDDNWAFAQADAPPLAAALGAGIQWVALDDAINQMIDAEAGMLGENEGDVP